MSVSVTLVFPDAAAAADALGRMAHAPAPVIAHEDRPDVGAPPASLALSPAEVFAGAPVIWPTPTQLDAELPPAQQTPAVVPPPAPALTLPSAATVPSAAPAQAAAPTSTERDVAGLPWDSRIHAETKTKNKDGTWRTKRNIDPAFKAQVEADLGAVPPAPPAAQVPPAPPAAQVPPAPPAAQVPPAPPAASGPVGFAMYMAQISEAFSNKPLEAQAAMAKALAPHGLAHVGQLAGRDDLIPTVDAAFRAAMAA